MKKKLLIILGFLFICIVFLRLSFPKPYYHYFCKSTDLTQENVDGIYLGESINSDKVRNKYGNINKLSRDNIKYNYYYLDEGNEVVTEKYDNKIIRFIVNDKNIVSEKNIKIGDSKEKIIKAYGNSYYKRVEQGTNIIGYADRKNKTTLEFWMYEEKVVFFRFDYKYME